MKKNIINIKKTLIILIIFLIMGSITFCVNAFTGDISGFDEGKEISTVDTAVDKVGTTVITIIRVVAVTIAIVMLLAISMRYMTAAPGERADIKKHAIAYVVGAFILFGVTGILTILTDFASKITPSGT